MDLNPRRPMSVLVVLIGLVVIGATAVHGDSWDLPWPRVFSSESGSCGLKLLTTRDRQGFSRTAVMFALDAEGNEEIIWKQSLVNIPRDVYISTDGKRVVTLDSLGRVGQAHSLVVYDEKGKVLGDFGWSNF